MPLGFPGGANGKESACQCRRCKRRRFDPWGQKIPRRRAWQPIPVFFPGESLGQRSLAGYGPQCCRELDTNKRLNNIHTHTYIYTQIYHIFLIHSSVSGHLGSFHVLAIVNRAAVNTGVIYLFELDFSSFPDTCPGVELLDYVVTLF